jgi:hypothetical protein
MSSNNKKDPPMDQGDEKTADSIRTTSSSNKKKDDKDRKGRPKEDSDEPSTAPADSVTGVTTASSSNSHDRAIRKPRHHARRKGGDPELDYGTTKEDPDKLSTAPADSVTGVTTATSSKSHDGAIVRKPGYRETRAAQEDIENNLYVDSSSDDDSLTPGAVHVGGVMKTLDSTRTFSESVIVDEPQQPAADRAVATMPSVLHLVAELVPETDDVQAENERLREELQLEREEREKQQQKDINTVVAVASSAEPIVEENNFTKRKTMIYCGIAAVFVLIGVAVGVAVGVTPAPDNNTTDAPTPSQATIPPSKPPIVSPTDEPSKSPTMRPTIEPSLSPTKPSRFDLFLEALLVQDPDLEVSVFTNSGTSTPQYRALSWLANEDALNLDPETAPGRDILERFVLVTFFFSTDGDNWRNTFKFLQKRSVCEWNNGEPLDSDLFGGIVCNGSGQVATLSMGKLVLLFCR